MDSERVGFERVRDRDLATLLVEELAVEPRFRSWLLAEAGIDATGTTVERTARVADESGRAAVVASLADANDASCRLVLSIRLDDSPATDEAVRESIDREPSRVGSIDREPSDAGSIDRAVARSDRERTETRLCLVAPEATASADPRPEFDATIPLESVRDWFASRDGDRAAFRATLLSRAVPADGRDPQGGDEVGGTAGDERPDRDRVDDWTAALVRQYRETAIDRAPALEDAIEPAAIDAGGDAAADSDSKPAIAFDPPRLADDHALAHDVTAGTIDLRIPGAAEYLQSFAVRYASTLSPGVNLLTDGDALVVRHEAPPIERGEESSRVRDAIEEGLAAARELVALSETVRERSV